jgi:hypothetical protein
MLGQHPQLYGMPEMQLFGARTVGEWLERSSAASFPMADGLLRAVAELLFGEQSGRTIVLARRWLTARPDRPTPAVFRQLAARVAPRMVVEKSPSLVYEQRSMRRAQRAFPCARFLHLVRHPTGHGESVLKHIRESRRHGPVPRWLLGMAGYESRNGDGTWMPSPERSWYGLHTNVLAFLRDVPPERQLRVRGEDVLTQPERTLAGVASWLGLRTDRDAIDAMLHPERSPFARFGPPGARFGNDVFFLRSPELRPARAVHHRLDDPVPWRDDGALLAADVVELAQEFGYD